jgi:hypothetical protein
MNIQNRRDFLKLLGKGTAGTFIVPHFLVACSNPAEKEKPSTSIEKIEGISPSDKDDLVLAKGLNYSILASELDSIGKDLVFGSNNDFTCFIPINNNPNHGYLWVNHEALHPLFVSGYAFGEDEERTIEQVNQEMKMVGGSILEIKKDDSGNWIFDPSSPNNKRLDATTPIALNWDEPIEGSNEVIGTHSNCSGGITPWGTVLTCEENYDNFFGETLIDESGNKTHLKSSYGWDKFYPYPPEHYGWVVEVDPATGDAQKHIAIGRFSHECCTLKQLEDGRIVAYSGDDSNDEFVYKFVGSKPKSLKEGTLYVADTENGKWISLNYNDQPILKQHFKNQTDVLVHCRKAGKLVGATPQNRPEDIEIDPLTGHIIISMTNNKPKGDYHGSIVKIIEDNNQYDGTSFTTETLKAGGEETGFSCPDNLAFDSKGNLWFTSDISGSVMNKVDQPYSAFKNNGLFVLLRNGEQAGDIIQVASAPTDAELTGPWFSSDEKTLFLSVQHPGAESKSLDALTSNWPKGGNEIPRCSVVTIQGELLDRICG